MKFVQLTLVLPLSPPVTNKYAEAPLLFFATPYLPLLHHTDARQTKQSIVHLLHTYFSLIPPYFYYITQTHRHQAAEPAALLVGHAKL